MAREPDIFFDGAHNPEGMEHAVASIKGYYPDKKVALIMGVMKDKDYESMIKTCAPIIGHAFTVTPDNPRALTAEELAHAFADNGNIIGRLLGAIGNTHAAGEVDESNVNTGLLLQFNC